MSDYDSKSIPVLNDVIADDDITDEHEVVDLSNLKAPLDDENFDLFTDELTDRLTESIDDTEVITAEKSNAETADNENITPEIGDINEVVNQDDPLSIDTTSIGEAAIGATAFSTLKDDELTARISDEIDIAIGNEKKSYFEEDSNLSTDLSEDKPEEDEPEIESALIDYQTTDYHTDEEDISPVEAEIPLVTTIDKQEVETTQADADTPAMPPTSLETMTEDIVKQIMPGLEEQLRSLVQQALEEKLGEEFTLSSTTSDSQEQ